MPGTNYQCSPVPISMKKDICYSATVRQGSFVACRAMATMSKVAATDPEMPPHAHMCNQGISRFDNPLQYYPWLDRSEGVTWILQLKVSMCVEGVDVEAVPCACMKHS